MNEKRQIGSAKQLIRPLIRLPVPLVSSGDQSSASLTSAVNKFPIQMDQRKERKVSHCELFLHRLGTRGKCFGVQENQINNNKHFRRKIAFRTVGVGRESDF